ncbi:hypothetical protein [Bartonella massiliensis]|uniref:hypothetical protein n=1 Tax=Bartonella massiliensis TaxID=929795 RepID=UPI00115C3B1F|nr:hypothetical protein [Bartonella massiliensis]
MNTKGHPVDQATNQVQSHQFSSFIEQKERIDTPVEVTMSDIAQKLRTVYAQMQMKPSSRPLKQQSFAEEHFKSYLDDISRAILAEYYIRRQREKKLFESLEQIKILVQNLQREKKILEEATVTRQVSRSKLSDSVVQKLAHMECEGDQERLRLYKGQNFSKQNSIAPLQTNVENGLQQENKSSVSSNVLSPRDALLPGNVLKPAFKQGEKTVKQGEKTVERAVIEEKGNGVQTSNHRIENDFSSVFKARSYKRVSFLSHFLKKSILCFFTIAFVGAITVCFYSFLKGVRFFNFL